MSKRGNIFEALSEPEEKEAVTPGSKVEIIKKAPAKREPLKAKVAQPMQEKTQDSRTVEGEEEF